MGHGLGFRVPQHHPLYYPPGFSPVAKGLEGELSLIQVNSRRT